MKAIKWYYDHGSLLGEAFATVDEAARSALHASEMGTESLVCIETEEGERIGWDHPTLIKVEQEIEQIWQSTTPDPAALTHYVQAQAPNGEWALIASVATEREAAADRDEMAAVIGADRVDMRHRDLPPRR